MPRNTTYADDMKLVLNGNAKPWGPDGYAYDVEWTRNIAMHCLTIIGQWSYGATQTDIAESIKADDTTYVEATMLRAILTALVELGAIEVERWGAVRYHLVAGK